MTLILTALIILVFSYFGLPHILGNYFWFESFGYSWVYVRTLMYQCLSTLTPIAICFLAFLINFPLNIALVSIAFSLQLSVLETSVFLTIVFTTVAIIRKTYTRMYFETRNLKKKAKKG